MIMIYLKFYLLSKLQQLFNCDILILLVVLIRVKFSPAQEEYVMEGIQIDRRGWMKRNLNLEWFLLRNYVN